MFLRLHSPTWNRIDSLTKERRSLKSCTSSAVSQGKQLSSLEPGWISTQVYLAEMGQTGQE